jgi:prophage regulatory protein
MRFVVEYRFVLSLAMSAMIGVTGLHAWPFPAANVFLALIQARQPALYAGFSYTYATLWFSTPFLMLSGGFSFLYIFVTRWDRPTTSQPLPPYPAPDTREDLFLILGERHRQTSPQRASAPTWLTIPERGADTDRALRRGPRSLRARGAVRIGRVSPAQYRRSRMNRLPAKTKGPIRVPASGQAITDGHARLMPDASGETPRVSQSLDRVLSLKLLRFPAVRERTGLSRSTIWRLERRGDFPKHRRISANVVAWVEAEVMSWIHSRVGDIAV